MPNDLVCEPCSKSGLNASTMEKHLESRAHKETLGLPVEDLPPAALEEALSVVDPIECARAVRKVYSKNRWPNRTWHKSVKQVLEERGVPTFNSPYRIMTEGEARKHRREQLSAVQESN